LLLIELYADRCVRHSRDFQNALANGILQERRMIWAFISGMCYCTWGGFRKKGSTRETEEKLDGKYKEGHEREKPKCRPLGR